jgi:hypothetical protein
VLYREREDVYQRTTTPVEIQFSETTPVVMGKPADLRTGAVVLVKGTVNASLGAGCATNRRHGHVQMR